MDIYREINMHVSSHQLHLNSLERSIEELIRLNLKTINNFSAAYPSHFLKCDDAESFIDINVDVMVQNGHQLLDYFHDAYGIMEKCWLTLSLDVLEKNHEVLQNSLPQEWEHRVQNKMSH